MSLVPTPLASSTEATSALRKANQVPYETKSSLPKPMWRPRQKAPCEASGEVPQGEVSPQLCLSREDKDKLPIQFGSFTEAISREAKLMTLPSPNLGAVTPCANLVLPSEVPDGMANSTPVSQYASEILSTKAGPAALSNAKHLRNKAVNKAPQCASLSKASGVKFAPRSKAKGSSLGADSGAYAASALKGATKVLSREARTKALSSVNCLCGDEKNEAPSRASLPRPADAKSVPHKAMSKKVMSKSPEQINAPFARVSALSRLSSIKSDLREFLTNKRMLELLQTSLSCCEQVGCQLVMVHSVHCRLIGTEPALKKV